MLFILRILTRLIELAVTIPIRAAAAAIVNLAYNPRLGWLRYPVFGAGAYVAFAVVLVYIAAPLRGIIGANYEASSLNYAAERWAATAIYDQRGDFVGLYNPRLDSERDVNSSGRAIRIAQHVANPDHKAIPVLDIPEDYWRCLLYHEDRYLGGWRNPYGIDLIGVLKIPYTTIMRTLRTGRVSFGVGGSTLPMQFVRVIYKTPPRTNESPWEKIGRKMREWWMAPVVYHHLTRGGDLTPLKQWAANHIWLAQRTGGAPLHGVEVTSQIVFGKDARDLTTAEQFVLASAVNKPIILLPGSDRLNRVRLDRWQYITEVRATRCASELIRDPELQKQVVSELIQMASGPPDPKVRPRLQAALETFGPRYAKRAEANPYIRAQTLMPTSQLGIREEMKSVFGYPWRNHVRTVRTTLDAAENLRFRDAIKRTLSGLDTRYGSRLKPGFTLDPAKGGGGRRMPDVVVVAADRENRIVRYYEATSTASYFGSPFARNASTGRYDPAREGRAIASVGKMISAIAIGNEGRDTHRALYVDATAPGRGLETCRRNGNLRRGRRAEVAFACSLNAPIAWRTAKVGQAQVRDLIDRLGFQMPPEGPDDAAATPPSTAAVRGFIAGAPRRVHQMAATVLAVAGGWGGEHLGRPTLVTEFVGRDEASTAKLNEARQQGLTPNEIIKPEAAPLVTKLLSSPLCYRAGGRSHGTLKTLSNWCAERRRDLRFHFAKTGTQVNEDPDETVDVWAAGGLQFESGAAFSYVVLVGTATPSDPFARSLHASQIAAPLLNTLLKDLADLAGETAVADARAAGARTSSSLVRTAHRPTSANAAVRLPVKRKARPASRKRLAAARRRKRARNTVKPFSVDSFFKQLEARRRD